MNSPAPPIASSATSLAAKLLEARKDVELVGHVLEEATRTRDVVAGELEAAERAVTEAVARQHDAESAVVANETASTRTALEDADRALRVVLVRRDSAQARMAAAETSAATATTALAARKREARGLELRIAGHRDTLHAKLDPLVLEALAHLESFIAACKKAQDAIDASTSSAAAFEREGFGAADDPRSGATWRHQSGVLVAVLEALATRGVVPTNAEKRALQDVSPPTRTASGGGRFVRALGERPGAVAQALFPLLAPEHGTFDPAGETVAIWLEELRDAREAGASAVTRKVREDAARARANAVPSPAPSSGLRAGIFLRRPEASNDDAVPAPATKATTAARPRASRA